jgi:hypothetical protein
MQPRYSSNPKRASQAGMYCRADNGVQAPAWIFVCLKTFRSALPGHRGDHGDAVYQVCDVPPRKTVRVWPMIKIKIPGAAISQRLIPPSANGDRSVLGSPVLEECTHQEPSIAPALLNVLQCSRHRLAIL